MTKEAFLSELRNGLAGLPQDDTEERLSFYAEMIDDRMEEGISEEEAVAGIGPVSEVIRQIISEIPLSRIVKEKIRPKRTLRAWEIVLLVLGFPLWFPLLIAAFAVLLSLYLALWALLVSLWSIEVSLAALALAGIAVSVLQAVRGQFLPAVFLLGAALFCGGAAVFLFPACTAASKGLVLLAKKAVDSLKNLFVRKESAS